VIPLQFYTNSDIVEVVAKFNQDKSRQDCLYQLNKMEEGRFIAMHHQNVQKQQQKARHDCHLKKEIKMET
jgi:hypothetical protein